jgi:type 1 glutamine amidotransferase
MKTTVALTSLVLGLVTSPLLAAGVVYEGGAGPGKGKHIVLVSGDEEYRSEEALPQLGKILAKHHGFKCTVLFAIDPNDGTINPNVSNIPGLEALATADLMVIFTRFRDLPDEQMRHIVAYVEAGKPIVGIRTATHAFSIPSGKTYSKYSYNSRDESYSQGFGRQVLGETWISHHGRHGSQSTRGILVKGQENHPILRGIRDGDIWGPTDVYGVRLPLPGDSQPLVLGQVLAGMRPDDPPASPAEDRKSKPIVDPNDPMMPIAWTKTYTGSAGNKGRVFCSTLGAANDLTAEGSRRLLVNACYWAVGLEDQIPAKSNVALVGDYQPSSFKNSGFKPGVKPEDYRLK